MSTVSQTGRDGPATTFDPRVAHPARVYAYWLGVILSFCVGRGL
jgi:hypothetical protein